MNRLEKQEVVKRQLRAEFQREQASDFELLRRIPSTGVRKFLDYFTKLNRSERDALSEAMAQLALVTFFPYDVQTPYAAGNAAYKQYVKSACSSGWRYQSVRDLAHIDVKKLEGFESVSFPVSDDIKKWLGGIKPAKSTEIRRMVKLALSQTIGPLVVSHEGGLWHYQGDLQGRSLRINIDYHQKYAQFDYGIEHPYQEQEVGKLRLDMSYEQLMGLSSRWDCVEEANLDQSIALLKDLVVRCAQFMNALPP
jgi:hypothetical protein